MADNLDPIISSDPTSVPPTPAPNPFASSADTAPAATPTPAPAPTANPFASSTPISNSADMTVHKSHKSTVMLLILLLVALAGAAYYYFFMMNDNGMNNNNQPIVTETITTDTSADIDMTNDMITDTDMDMDMMNTDDDMSMDSDMDDMTDGSLTIDMKKADDLMQIAAALDIYNADKNMFPANMDALAAHVQNSIMLPSDPEANITWMGFNKMNVNGYIYSSLYRNGKAGGAAIIMARTNTPAGSNRIDADPALSQMSNISRADAAAIEKMICNNITITETSVDSLKNCTAAKDSTNLRYIIIK